MIGPSQSGTMPTKQGLDQGQIEDYVKRISRQLIERHRKRNARGRRGRHEAADRLIQAQHEQDRMGVQQELERLDRYQASAAQLQAEAARQLRRQRATTLPSAARKSGSGTASFYRQAILMEEAERYRADREDVDRSPEAIRKGSGVPAYDIRGYFRLFSSEHREGRRVPNKTDRSSVEHFGTRLFGAP
jgi:hypothetical protein